MHTPSDPDSNPGHFYKLKRDGSWHKKTEGGTYSELPNKKALQRLWIASAKSFKRIE